MTGNCLAKRAHRIAVSIPSLSSAQRRIGSPPMRIDLIAVVDVL
jgi:hypothetical protein